ncbi:hypothetical protein QL285_065288 [Trifolium repens]|nr:hypothetical protein QL285_065288 [Trifolium repens]
MIKVLVDAEFWLGSRQVAPGTQERPVWPVASVSWRQAQGSGARREFADIYPLFQFSAAVREKEARVLRGFCSNIKSRIKRVIS